MLPHHPVEVHRDLLIVELLAHDVVTMLQQTSLEKVKKEMLTNLQSRYLLTDNNVECIHMYYKIVKTTFLNIAQLINSSLENLNNLTESITQCKFKYLLFLPSIET